MIVVTLGKVRQFKYALQMTKKILKNRGKAQLFNTLKQTKQTLLFKATGVQ